MPYWPLASNENILESGHKAGHRVVAHQRAHGFGQDTDRINDRRKPEPELDDDAEELADIAEEYIEHPKTDAQADGKGDEDGQNRDHGQINQAGEVAGNQQENTEQTKYDGEIQQCIGDHGDWQTQPGEAEFLEQIGVLKKGVLCAANDFREQPPGQYASAQVNAVGKGAIDAR